MSYQETVYQQVNIVDSNGNIIDSFSGSSSGGFIISVQRTPYLETTSSAGNISAGTVSISISNIGNASGEVLGVSVPTGATVSYDAPNEDSIGAIAYNATGTTFLISSLR